MAFFFFPWIFAILGDAIFTADWKWFALFSPFAFVFRLWWRMANPKDGRQFKILVKWPEYSLLRLRLCVAFGWGAFALVLIACAVVLRDQLARSWTGALGLAGAGILVVDSLSIILAAWTMPQILAEAGLVEASPTKE
ncbi:MAG: hypothetical protein ACREJD_15140 [Phycisphaerales bacterium]